MSERIGFIGVGLMGHGMAKNLIEKGFPLAVMGHRNRAPVEDLVKRGAREATSAAEVAHASDILFLCVTGSTQVEALVRGVRRSTSSPSPTRTRTCATSPPWRRAPASPIPWAWR
jgi:3-hydroxyisobutyrate dehydrogenase-like beta-hydroxyacid dehydrogenase